MQNARIKCPIPACKGFLELTEVFKSYDANGRKLFRTSPMVCDWCRTRLPETMKPKQHAHVGSNSWLSDQRYSEAYKAVEAATSHAKTWMKSYEESKKISSRSKKRRVATRNVSRK